jgi:hypothetical protein
MYRATVWPTATMAMTIAGSHVRLPITQAPRDPQQGDAAQQGLP